jgi:putative ABC transport system permease protein
MIKSYLTVALKHLTGQRLYSAINIAGLAVGLACFILIALFVRHELGYDRHFANAERIYRISRDFFGARSAETNLLPAAHSRKLSEAIDSGLKRHREAGPEPT